MASDQIKRTGGSTQDGSQVISFHPMLRGDRFCWERAILDRDVVGMLRSARAVLLPQTVSRELYFLCRNLCPRIFPNYDFRFQWEGKIGDAMLFWTFQAPHPKTWIFPRIESLTGNHPEMEQTKRLPDYPFVLKGATGGEGRQTYLIRNEQDLKKALDVLKHLEWQGMPGFVIQEYISGLKRDLRVVVVGQTIKSYWRINPNGFHKNLAMGGEVDTASDPELRTLGMEMVKDLCLKTGINLAGFDLVFPEGGGGPLFLEINYTFGRTGLGGSDAFYSLLNSEVQHWLDNARDKG